MAATLLSDVIVPPVFTDYVRNKTAELSALRNSGIIAADPVFQANANGAGHFVDVPYFNDLTGVAERLVDTAALTVNKITTAQDTAVKILRGKAWGASDLAGLLSGSDPMGAIADRVAAFWAREEQRALIQTLTGVFATALGGSHALDVTGASTPLNATVILDGKQKLGDAAESLTAIAMHSVKYTELQKAQLIVYVPNADATVRFPTYLGYRVIVDDGLPVAGGNYTSYLFGAGAIAGASIAVPNGTETDRDSLGGSDVLISRTGFVMHVHGVRYVSANTNPTDAQLATGASWSKVYEDKQIRVVKLLTK